MSKNQRDTPWEPWDGEYIGNIWGRKFTIISFAIIMFFAILLTIRYITIDPETLQNNRDNLETQVDSLR